MKGKIFSLFLILITTMIFSPIKGLAETVDEYEIWVGGVQVTESNKNDVLGDLDGNKATVIFIPASGDKEAKLILNDANIHEGHFDQARTTFSAIQSEIDMTIEIKGNNVLGKYLGEETGTDRDVDKYSVDYGILDEHKNLNFIGDGSLTIVDKNDGIFAKDITFDKDFGTLTIEDDGRAVILPPCAISSGGTVTINGGNFYLTSIGENGITAYNKVIINDGFIKIKTTSDKNAIFTNDGIVINDNMEVINAEYIKGTTNQLWVSNIDIDDGFVTIKGTKKNITFNSNGGSSVDSQEVSYGNKITKPTNPTKENYVFDGWYIDEQLSEQFDFNTAITNDITLYAKWREVESFTYKFISGDNQELTSGDIKLYVLKIDGDYSLFESLKIGNLDLIKDEDYEVTEGSTVITFTDKGIAKLNALSKGEYEIVVKYSNEEEVKGKLIMKQFDIPEPEDNPEIENPKTGDNIASYLIIGSLSLISLAGCSLYLNRKRFN